MLLLAITLSALALTAALVLLDIHHRRKTRENTARVERLLRELLEESRA